MWTSGFLQGQEDRLTSLTLLYPSMNQELQDILGFAARAEVRRLEKYRQLLNKAFRLLDSGH